ncbi:site-specific integrase [Vibrio harveyi]|uniref:site-specific integrase n=1 Tax=Vibrio harveyi TaxID=669 RepID=UPI0018F14742|nr:site-specific integrase [Vibrio harveyi]
MRYLSISKSGIWQFRFQIPSEHRDLFDGRREIKRSLKTSDKQVATIHALQLEIEIRKSLTSPPPSSKNKKLEVQTPPKSISVQRPKQRLNNTPQHALDLFIKYKRAHLSDKSVVMLQAKCNVVLDLLNKKQLALIRRTDAEQVIDLLRRYPTNLKKHRQFSGLSGTQAIKLNKELGLPTLSEESVKDYSQKMSGFFEWCVLNELTDINPFKAIRFKKQRKDSAAKSAYSSTDLHKLFGTPVHCERDFKHPYYYWLPLLGYFTGARLNELCQLYKADIYRKEGIWVLQIDDRFEGQKLKNLTSRRIVPIHQRLIDIGFIDYLTSVQHDRLFPELKDSRDGFGSAASKWFGRFKTRLGFAKGHDFHSFRHTVATQLKQQQVSHIAAGAILGHAQNNITYDRYGKDLSIEQVKTVVNLIDPRPLDKVQNYST